MIQDGNPNRIRIHRANLLPIMIRSIQVKNVRGIEDKTFAFDNPEMRPNKVHLLIAPNGFGKSSIATAFANLNSKRLTLKEKDCYLHDEARRPTLVVKVRNGATEQCLGADQTKNEIGKEFDTFVIRGPRKVKAFQRPAQSGYQVPVGEFVIEPIELTRVPEKVVIAYKCRESAASLGGASKAAPNISDELLDSRVIKAFLSSKYAEKELGQKMQSRYDQLLMRLRSLGGKTEEVIQQVEDTVWTDVDAMPEMAGVIEVFSHLNSRAQALLAAIQLIEAARANIKATKAALKWQEYEMKYKRAKSLLASCTPNPGWIKVDIKKTDQTLVICLPKPDTMSNGQRDFLCFVTQLLEFEFKADKGKTILLIDEIFDYLDYANMVACQYFLARFIEAHKEEGTQVYPLVLTHLDPSVFNSYIFSSKLQRNHYLDGVQPVSGHGGLFKIIRMRSEDAELEGIFATFHAHHSVSHCDERALFERKGLKTNWGCSQTFKAYCGEHLQSYLEGASGEVDYLAVCLALRVRIEECACRQLSHEKQIEFTGVKRTVSKLEFAEANGATVPELHYLLAGLYNSALHDTGPDKDFLTPVVSKLQNACVRDMIRDATESF